MEHRKVSASDLQSCLICAIIAKIYCSLSQKKKQEFHRKSYVLTQRHICKPAHSLSEFIIANLYQYKNRLELKNIDFNPLYFMHIMRI